jgi:hypothetical protein
MEGLASNRFRQLGAWNILHFTNHACSFKVNHIALVTKPPLKKVKHLLLDTGSVTVSHIKVQSTLDSLWVLFNDLRCVTDQHAEGHRVFERGSRTRLSTAKLLNHLRDRHSILPPNKIE